MGAMRDQRSFLLASLLSGLLLTALPVLTQAQSECSPDNQTRAVELQMQAKKFLNEGRLDQSIEALRSAYSECPEAIILSYLGMVLQKADKLSEALEAYRSCVRDALDESTRGECRLKVLELEARLEPPMPAPEPEPEPETMLIVITEPTNAQIYLDEKPESQPYGEAIEVLPGPHKVQVRAVGFQTYEDIREVEEGKTLRLTVTLLPAPVELLVDELVEQLDEEPEETVDAPPSDVRRTGAWASFGTGGAVLVTGTVLAILGHLDTRAAEKLDPCDDFGGDYDKYNDAFGSKRTSARLKGYSGVGLICLGVAAIGTGVALYLISEDDSVTSTTIVPLGVDGPGVAATIRW